MGVTRVLFNGKVIFDLSSDSVSEEKLLMNETAHDHSGNAITGQLVKRETGPFIIDENGIAHIISYEDVIISE